MNGPKRARDGPGGSILVLERPPWLVGGTGQYEGTDGLSGRGTNGLNVGILFMFSSESSGVELVVCMMRDYEWGVLSRGCHFNRLVSMIRTEQAQIMLTVIATLLVYLGSLGDICTRQRVADVSIDVYLPK